MREGGVISPVSHPPSRLNCQEGQLHWDAWVRCSAHFPLMTLGPALPPATWSDGWRNGEGSFLPTPPYGRLGIEPDIPCILQITFAAYQDGQLYCAVPVSYKAWSSKCCSQWRAGWVHLFSWPWDELLSAAKDEGRLFSKLHISPALAIGWVSSTSHWGLSCWSGPKSN